MYRSRTRCRMAQCRETILKMEEWSTNSTVKRASVSVALLSFIVTKGSGMALHQAVSQMVSISESCPALFTCSIQQQQRKNFIPLRRIIIKFPYNAHSDWLKQRTLSAYKGQVNDIKLAFKFLLRNFDKFDLN